MGEKGREPFNRVSIEGEKKEKKSGALGGGGERWWEGKRR